MGDNTKSLITFGFLAILGLMFALTSISLMQLHDLNSSMETLVEVTNKKTAAVHEMRDAIRLRADSLKAMQLAVDPFLRDEEFQRFNNYAGKYRRAREQLVNLGMDGRETEIHERLQQLTRTSQPFNDQASQLLMSDAPATDLTPVLETSRTLQNLILEQLEQLVQIEHNNTQHALDASRTHYGQTRGLLLVLTIIALLLSLLVTRIVIQRVTTKNRQLCYQASHDSLTGLINRREFELRVERAIRQAHQQAATHALLYLDLDQFKVVNDTCGHAAGDELLQQLARLLASSVRQRDTLSRLGGDEFGMLLENCPLDRAVTIANNLLKAIESFHFSWGDSNFTLGISIGVVPIDRGTSDIASAMSAADSACYIAKESGRNQVQIAHLGDRRLQQRHGEMQWVARLTRALDERQFELWFQSITPAAETRNPARFVEFLVRMIDDDGTVIAPRVFLPAAEKYNLASAIDRWVIEQTMTWLAQHNDRQQWPITVSINLSGQSICNPEMQKFILETLASSGATPDQIIFEITETSAIANIAAATSFMLTLRGCGFRFALDDFGTGLSSFSYLKKLPVDYLKIDGSYIRDILSDPVDYAMVKSINELGQLLGKQTIAEYVETDEVAAELRHMGIDYLQGHVYSKPQPLCELQPSVRPRLVLISS